jgi:hypothetical protein
VSDARARVPAGEASIRRGEYVARAADCAACHTLGSGAPYAGGLPFHLPFGTIYATNITPDAETGIGRWSDAEFVRALHHGVGRDGRNLYPAFPYAAYPLMSTEDALALKDYLFSLPAARSSPPAAELSFPFNQHYLMRGWNLLFKPSPATSRRRSAPPSGIAVPISWRAWGIAANAIRHAISSSRWMAAGSLLAPSRPGRRPTIFRRMPSPASAPGRMPRSRINYLKARQPGQRFLTPRGLAGLGWGFPMALGAKVARPGAQVFCVAGDGGFGHVWSELETARRMGIKVVLLLINNGILGFQKHAENVKFGKHTTAVHFHPVDHAAIARATGCLGLRVEDPAQLAGALREAMAAETTALVEVLCDQNAYPPITFYTPGQEA